ncbi:MAG TPA: ABC transporter permease subunit [Candidatus Limnocylindria bacterium]
MSVVAAELLKLRRSWSTPILIGILALVELLLGYLLIYLIAQVPPPPGEPAFGEALLLTLRPENFVSNVLNMLASLGGALALVLGAMHSAREYGWRTISTILTQGPTRLAVLAAKAAALAVVVVVMVLVTFAMGAIGTSVVAGLQGKPIAFPAVGEIASGVVVGCLIVGAWAAVGFALGFLLRSTGLAIGLGLVYALVIESVIQGLATINETIEAISRGLLGANGTALASSFGPDAVADQFGVVGIDPPVAAAVLAGYIVVALAAAALVFARRDVTT